jgi:prepilin signal peptidase PulO-like enzyme (type II secretory pathway)
MIVWYDNIPLLSYLFLGGRCKHCKQHISVQYPLVEFITGVLFVLAFYLNYELGIMNYNSVYQVFPIINNSLFLIQLFKYWFIVSVMIIVFIYDLRWYLILDVVTLPACVVVFFLNLSLGFTWQNLLFSGIIGGSFFLIQYVVSRGKWIGGGDIRLGLLIGLSLGTSNAILAIFLSYLLGSFVSIYLIVIGKKQWGSKIPLGIFLSVGAIISLFWGEAIVSWYLGYL